MGDRGVWHFHYYPRSLSLVQIAGKLVTKPKMIIKSNIKIMIKIMIKISVRNRIMTKKAQNICVPHVCPQTEPQLLERLTLPAWDHYDPPPPLLHAYEIVSVTSQSPSWPELFGPYFKLCYKQHVPRTQV